MAVSRLTLGGARPLQPRVETTSDFVHLTLDGLAPQPSDPPVPWRHPASRASRTRDRRSARRAGLALGSTGVAMVAAGV